MNECRNAHMSNSMDKKNKQTKKGMNEDLQIMVQMACVVATAVRCDMQDSSSSLALAVSLGPGVCSCEHIKRLTFTC